MAREKKKRMLHTYTVGVRSQIQREREVIIMAQDGKWVMARQTGCAPFVSHIDNFREVS